jgi:fatty-acyl-CoA synthase
MPGANHRRQSLLPSRPLERLLGVWADAPTTGEFQGSAGGSFGGYFVGFRGIRLINARGSQGLANARRAIAALRQRPRLRLSIERVVDEAARRQSLYQALYLRSFVPYPTPLAQLAVEICCELGAGGRELADVEERELMHCLSVQRLGCSARLSGMHRPKLCHTRTPSQAGPPQERVIRPRQEGGILRLDEGLLDRNNTIVADLAPAGATPTLDKLPRRIADFATLGEALDYAAQGRRGMNFHDARGQLTRAYPFSELRQDALAHAQRFVAMGLKPGDRLALIAETGAEFAACFFGAVYAGLWPVPLPLPTSFGGREAYVEQLRVMLGSSDPSLFLCPPDIFTYAEEAGASRGVRVVDWDKLGSIEAGTVELPTPDTDEVAYLQYSSGSTRFPHGVAVTHRQLLSNLRAHGIGLQVEETDRCISWLPWYHDMGLVGCMLSPMALQFSVDYMKTEDFARRPLAWLDMITRNPGNSVSYSPTFGYDICARRMSSQTRAEDRFDLSRWRIAGNGADMIRPDVMQAFVDAFADAGFKASAFCPSYGLAEATLAVSLMPPGEGIRLELVEEAVLGGGSSGADGRPRRYRAVVNCGKPVTGMQIEIRGEDGSVLPDRGIGRVFVRGSSVMHSYFRDPESTAACLSDDGWLDTGDMGYMSNGYIFIVGRAKDMIIINGRNHWPQDIEWAVEQLPGFKSGDIAAFAITGPSGEETPAVLVHCRVSDPQERGRLRDDIRERVRAITGITPIVELVPPRSLPRTSSGKLSRTKARNLYLSGEIQPFDIAA